MKVYKIKIIFIIFLSVFLLTSCSETNPTTECPDDEVEVEGTCISSDLIELANDINAVYIFDEEDNIVEEDIIDNIEVIVDYLLIRGITEDKEITYNISSDNDNYLDTYNNHVYLNIDHIDSFETVFHSILSLYDTKVNYGLLYGLSNYIAIELDYIEEPMNNDTLNYFLNVVKQDLMDLTYPTFTETYASLDDIENVKTLSIQFVSFIINENSIYDLIDLLALSEYDEFEHQYNACLNAWILDSGYDYEIPMNEYPILFDRNPRSYIAIWYTERASWYLSKNFDTHNRFKEIYGYLLTEDYKSLKDTIIIFEEDMTRTDGLLKDETIDYKDLKINLQSGRVGLYSAGSIYISTVVSLSHEYIHYLTFPYIYYGSSSSIQWIGEAVAAYYSFDSYYMDIYMQDFYFADNDYRVPGDIMERTVQKFYELNDREPEYLEDKMELNDIYVYLSDDYDDVYQEYNINSTLQYISFVNYMISTYNHEIFITVCEDSSRLDELTGKTWPEHISDWEQYIKAKYE